MPQLRLPFWGTLRVDDGLHPNVGRLIRGSRAFRLRERGVVLELVVDGEAERHHLPDGHALPRVELVQPLEHIDLV